MPSGGKRPGAGRKALKDRPTKAHVENASEIYDRLQPKAALTLEEGLTATKREPRICGRDENGAPEYEYVTVPDYPTRIKAALGIAAKRIPDIARQQITGPDGEKLEVIISDYRAPRNPTSAKAE